MSHTIKVIGEVRSLPYLQAACSRLGYKEPTYVKDKQIAAGEPASGYMVHLRGWNKPTVFNLETGQIYFDNWPDYNAKHPDVLAGRRQLGEGGRWGPIERLWELQDQYLAEVHVATAAEQGDTIEWVQQEPGKLEFVIHHHN